MDHAYKDLQNRLFFLLGTELPLLLKISVWENNVHITGLGKNASPVEIFRLS